MPRPLFIAFVFCVLVLPFDRAFAATEVPIVFRNGMLRVKVTTPAGGEPLTFLLDSGAGASVIDLATARRLALPLGTPEPVRGVHTKGVAYRVDRIAATLGAVAVPHSMLALDLRAIGGAVGCRIDGLLGADFFRGRIVQLDYAAGKMRLLSRDELSPAGAEILPLARRNGIFCVLADLGGKRGERLRVDTGCSSALEWVMSGNRRGAGGPTSIGVFDVHSRSACLEVRLGPLRLGDVKTGLHREPIFPGEDGLLGNGLLSRFTVTIDAAADRLILQRR